MSACCIKMYRKYSTNLSSSFYVTTPIYYVNANPHIGHLYSSLIADAIARWHQISCDSLENSGKLSTGTDEHGTKIQQAAQKHNQKPQDYCDFISKQYKNLAETFSVDYTDFIRTSDETHKRSVEKFWNALNESGNVYKAKYEGWYCVSDECFLTESQLKEKIEPDGRKSIVSGESGHPVEWTEEVNYMFPLRRFQDDLKHWLNERDDRVRPFKFQRILLDMMDSGPLPDISISRPSNRVHWGIQVPDDASQTVYVWLDALVNYLTAAGYPSDGDFHQLKRQTCWPPNIQVIGKDILKFHGIYWPAFLMAVKLEPPRSLLCHSHWTVDGEKMSKSKGNVVCPQQRAETYTSEGLRYFLLREGVAHSDGNYSDTKVRRILNAELADTLGNLLSRCSATTLNPNQMFPQIEPEAFRSVASMDVTQKLINSLLTLPDICSEHYSNFQFHKAVDSVIATLHQANVFFETLRPWELRKVPEKSQELNVVLHVTLETLRVCGILLQPIIPNIATSLLDKINVPSHQRTVQDLRPFSFDQPGRSSSSSLGPNKTVLFQRILAVDKNQGRNKQKTSV